MKLVNQLTPETLIGDDDYCRVSTNDAAQNNHTEEAKIGALARQPHASLELEAEGGGLLSEYRRVKTGVEVLSTY